MKRLLGIALLFTVIGFAIPKPLFASVTPAPEKASPTPAIPLISGPTQSDQFQGTVIKVIETKTEEFYGSKNLYQLLEIKPAQKKDLKVAKTIIAESGGVMSQTTQIYKVGDKVVVSEIENNGKNSFYILDYVRTGALIELFVLFIIVTVVVARKKGLLSLLGLVYSFFIIAAFVIPQLINGQNPVIIALFGGLLIIPVNFYLSHGFNKKTHIAVISTIFCLGITALLSHLFIGRAHLTGFATEDAAFLAILGDHTINMKSLLLAGIIVGLFGILDDVTISQAAIVEKLKETSPNIKFNDLYTKAMDIGKDHIGSLVNTLILVYAGGALPFVLLFVLNKQSFGVAINYEIISEEIVRTLSASIGLILAVPVTTFLASLWYKDPYT